MINVKKINLHLYNLFIPLVNYLKIFKDTIINKIKILKKYFCKIEGKNIFSIFMVYGSGFYY